MNKYSEKQPNNPIQIKQDKISLMHISSAFLVASLCLLFNEIKITQESVSERKERVRQANKQFNGINVQLNKKADIRRI